MIIRDQVLTRTCQLYIDFFGPHNRDLYGEWATHTVRRFSSYHRDRQGNQQAASLTSGRGSEPRICWYSMAH